MIRARVWLMAALVLAASCSKKNNDAERGAAGDSTAALPADSIPRGPWMWLSTIGPADTAIAPDPTQYTVTFLPDSTARLLLFCNRGSGNYHIDGKSIRIGPIAVTRMACPPPTLDAQFGQELEAVRTWSVAGDTLRLDLFAGVGTMRFVR